MVDAAKQDDWLLQRRKHGGNTLYVLGESLIVSSGNRYIVIYLVSSKRRLEMHTCEADRNG